MSESIEISAPIMQRLERLKTRPDEAPIDVITRLLNYFDDDELDEVTTAAIKEGIKEYKAGKSISHEELGKELGFV